MKIRVSRGNIEREYNISFFDLVKIYFAVSLAATLLVFIAFFLIALLIGLF